MIYKFTVPGPPKGKGRPRVTSRGTFTLKDTIMYENLVRHSCKLGRPLEGMIKATIIAYYPIPKSTSNKKREQMIKGDIRPTKKPDIDNIAKSILDSINNIAYHDDSQVTDLITRKWYGEEPRVEVILEELNEVNIQERLGN